MPRHGLGENVPDLVALYGYRSLDPNLFFLSPWEFCQWYKPHRLRPPSDNYPWTKFTAEGRVRLAREKGIKVPVRFAAVRGNGQVGGFAGWFPRGPGG